MIPSLIMQRQILVLFLRYILEKGDEEKSAFVLRENAHLSISFSCITLLNSCIILLPKFSTGASRAALIVQGFHGLLVYANMFWYKHLLEYCQTKRQCPEGLLTQPEYLVLRYKKEDISFPDPKSAVRVDTQDIALEDLNNWPEIKQLVSNILMFQSRLNIDDQSDMSPESKLPLF